MTINHLTLVYTEKEVRDHLAKISASILHDEVVSRHRAGTLHELFRKDELIENISENWPFIENIDNLPVKDIVDEFQVWGAGIVDEDVDKLLGKNSDWTNKTHVEVFLKTEDGTMHCVPDLENEIKA